MLPSLRPIRNPFVALRAMYRALVEGWDAEGGPAEDGAVVAAGDSVRLENADG